MNYMVLKDGIVSALITGSVLVLAQKISEWGTFGVDGGGVKFHYFI